MPICLTSEYSLAWTLLLPYCNNNYLPWAPAYSLQAQRQPVARAGPQPQPESRAGAGAQAGAGRTRTPQEQQPRAQAGAGPAPPAQRVPRLQR